MDAQLTVTGNVGSDIELFGGGSQEWTYASFRLASTRRQLRNGAWQDSPTVWISVTCKNRALAENVKASVTKGDPVIVTGRLASSSFTKDQQTVERLVIEATSVGHDLSRGTSRFARVERPAPEASVAIEGPGATEASSVAGESSAAGGSGVDASSSSPQEQPAEAAA